jgi:dolichyl-phosphate-mannose-protein mannosyltransferase
MATVRPTMRLWWGLTGLFLFSLGLRLWGLGWFNSLVFDEVHYVNFALNYLQQQPVFDAHPPLGKYLIALGLVVGQHLAAYFHWPTFAYKEVWLSARGYRLLNATVGATVPLLVAALAWQISHGYAPARRRLFALLAGGLMAMEGLSLVESRFALINIYWLWFGLVGQLAWVTVRLRERVGQTPPHPPAGPWSLHGGRLVAGIALGAAISVKWNGASFWLGLLGLELLAGRWRRWRISGSWQATPLPWRTGVMYLGLVPLLTYGLLWIPHLGLNEVSLIEVHRQLWGFHQSLASGVEVHPYCSAWYTWPLMVRPVAYFYDSVNAIPQQNILAPLASTGITTYTVQAMGNPILWWLSTAAMVALMGSQGARFYQTWRSPTTVDQLSHPVVLFVLVNYGANWLPWAMVQRCTFFYHALGMVPFGGLALAWLCCRWWMTGTPTHRGLTLVMLGIIGLGFWFWLPLFLGLPLSPEALQHRWWLRSWI